MVAKTRDLKHKLHKPWEWHLAIDGEATYRVDEQAFERVRETIAGVPRGMDTEQLARIRDQAFTGTIEVSRTRDAKSGKPRRQRGR